MTQKDNFIARHIGPRAEEMQEMLQIVGCDSLDELTSKAVPDAIRQQAENTLDGIRCQESEADALNYLKKLAAQNDLYRSLIGMGYYGTITPPVIQRNILENPGWYTQYTPYQPEISQGRLEALLNFQTMVSDLTALPIANASLLDEATAAAEAMSMSYGLVTKKKKEADTFLVSKNCFPQTLAVIETRAAALNLKVQHGDEKDFDFNEHVFGVLLQYPGADGEIDQYSELVKKAHAAGVMVTVAADLLSLALLSPPGDWGADIAVGTTQRFGVPLGYGGPHAAYFATKEEFKRVIPGRLVGVSKDKSGNPALRLALQTREQHIRRDKATSNICTAQVLLAIMAGMYGVYHGPKGIKRIATRINALTSALKEALAAAGLKVQNSYAFDTVTVSASASARSDILARAEKAKINLGLFSEDSVTFSLDELSNEEELKLLYKIFTAKDVAPETLSNAFKTCGTSSAIPAELLRKSAYLESDVFNAYHSETEFLRYLRRLESKDLSLATAMIPLGSCTMKLNATVEMIPVSWEGFAGLHPFAPPAQCKGYGQLFNELESALAELTGFDAVSLQPNAGSQGEYAGLSVIKAYHDRQGETQRDICIIPTSAHGTNPASAVMAGLKVVQVACNEQGDICIEDLKEKVEKHSSSLAALMVTYPSTHGVFEEAIREICELIHQHGGQVYLDGANLNALVGLAKPGEFGADVCHMNLHKTFAIPHGGGGPGVGPIGVKEHLVKFLPGHPVVPLEGRSNAAISAAPWGSAGVLPISWTYIALMGPRGLKHASELAILNANYVAKKLEKYYPVLYRGNAGYVAHECILDLREFKKTAGIEVDDIAKRLMDYGFHAPTVSWPVLGTVMVEPTESESKAELDRFCDAMISIYNEIQLIKDGKLPADDNPLKNAPHTAQAVMADEWTHPYSRSVAAYPSENLKIYKFWPAVERIDSSWGDRNLVCSCQ